MNVFFELAESLVGRKEVGLPGRYFAVYGAESGNEVQGRHLKLMQFSDRVWAEDNNGVRFMKHRYAYPTPKVDLKEFMWVKLRSVNV